MAKTIIKSYWLEMVYLFVLPVCIVIKALIDDPAKTFSYVLAILSVVMFLIAFGIQIHVRNEVAPRVSGIQQLIPSKYFDGVFKNGDETKAIIHKLEDGIIALQKTTQREDRYKPIGDCIKELSQSYQLIIYKCIVDNNDSIGDVNTERLFESVKRNILLLRRTLKEETEGFLSTNGPDSAEFVMNRQNKFTDVVLVGIGVPLLIEILKNNNNSIWDVWSILSGELCVLTSILVMVLSYRIMKYEKNKLSMVRTNTRRALYHKAGLLLDIFENALESEMCIYVPDNLADSNRLLN